MTGQSNARKTVGKNVESEATVDPVSISECAQSYSECKAVTAVESYQDVVNSLFSIMSRRLEAWMDQVSNQR